MSDNASSDNTDELGATISDFAEVVGKFKNVKNSVIKISIGIHDAGKFSPGLQSIHFFDKVKSLLDSNKMWDKTETVKSSGHKINNDVYTQEYSYSNTPFDFMVSASIENSGTEKISTSTREEIRYSYVHQDYMYHLTKVLQIEECITEEIYEFGIELLNITNNVSDIYRSHSALLKIRDIINTCETICGAKVFKIT